MTRSACSSRRCTGPLWPRGCEVKHLTGSHLATVLGALALLLFATVVLGLALGPSTLSVADVIDAKHSITNDRS